MNYPGGVSDGGDESTIPSQSVIFGLLGALMGISNGLGKEYRLQYIVLISDLVRTAGEVSMAAVPSVAQKDRQAG